MSRNSFWSRGALLSLLLATSITSIIGARTLQPIPVQASSASSQDKAKACNDAADKKGLKDQARKDFMQSCLNKAADAGSASEQDKAKTCNSLADKKNLTGADRRSFVKDCMKKANP
ncbi:MAG: PsiF family protein [Terracidiphilus sp.]